MDSLKFRFNFTTLDLQRVSDQPNPNDACHVNSVTTTTHPFGPINHQTEALPLSINGNTSERILRQFQTGFSPTAKKRLWSPSISIRNSALDSAVNSPSPKRRIVWEEQDTAKYEEEKVNNEDFQSEAINRYKVSPFEYFFEEEMLGQSKKVCGEIQDQPKPTETKKAKILDIRFGVFRFNPETGILKKNGFQIELPSREKRLFEKFAANPYKEMSISELAGNDLNPNGIVALIFNLKGHLGREKAGHYIGSAGRHTGAYHFLPDKIVTDNANAENIQSTDDPYDTIKYQSFQFNFGQYRAININTGEVIKFLGHHKTILQTLMKNSPGEVPLNKLGISRDKISIKKYINEINEMFKGEGDQGPFICKKRGFRNTTSYQIAEDDNLKTLNETEKIKPTPENREFSSTPTQKYHYKGTMLNFNKGCILLKDGQEIAFSSMQKKVLQFLLNFQGKRITAQEMVNAGLVKHVQKAINAITTLNGKMIVAGFQGTYIKNDGRSNPGYYLINE